MLGNFLKTFAVTAAMFFLFFYSTPYWTGAEMEDLMHNGLYRAFYVFCSKTGFWAYQFIERLSDKICSLLDRKGKSGRYRLIVYALLSLCLLTGAIAGLNRFYDYLFQSMFAVGDGITVSNEHSLLDRFSDLLIFFKLTAGYFDGTFLGFFRALGKALLMCMAYFWGTVVFFSFLYGLLSQKVVPLFGKSDFQTDSAQSNGSRSLLKQCVDGVKGAVEKLCYLRYFDLDVLPGTLPSFLLLVAIYALIQTWMGRESEAGVLFMEIVDNTGVIDLVINFIIQFIIGKLLYYICVPIYGALPRSIQATLQELSARGEAWVQLEKAKREQWAQNNDVLQNLDAWAVRERVDPMSPPESNTARQKPGFDPLKELNLDDDWHKK